MSRLRDDAERVMHPERSSPSRRPRPRRRRWAAIGGTALAAVLVGGTLSVMLSGRDDTRPLAAEASPTPTATVQTPSPTASASASPSPSATPAQTPEPTATPPPASDGGAWVGPERIATRDYGELSLVVDEAGIAHAAAVLHPGIYYLTNASGSWTREPVSDSADLLETGLYVTDPQIALDSDGSLWIAFALAWDGLGPPGGTVHYVTNRSGSWSESTVLAADGAHSPSLAVRDGRVHLAYLKGGLHYLTGTDGSWTETRVAESGAQPLLRLGADGSPRIVFGDRSGTLGDEQIWYATADPATGAFSLEAVPGTLPGASVYEPSAMAVDSAGDVHLVYSDSAVADDVQIGIDDSYHVVRRADGWSAPQLTIPDAWSRWIAVDRSGAAHVVGKGWTTNAVWYATDRHGSFEAKRLEPEASDPWIRGAALAVDALGRPHILFSLRVGHGSDEDGAWPSELWYAIGPGD
jgi:hypothetical protein